MSSTTTDRRLGLTGSAAIKVPCKAATIANITLSAAQTIDGVSCVAGDRVLVKSQTSSVDNGIYVVDTGTWTRDLDFDGVADVVTGTIVMVLNGSTNANTYWRLATTGTVTFGTSAITFAAALAGDSAMVTFLPSGIGTLTPQARTMQAKGREVITTADFSGSPPAGLVGIGPGVLAAITSGAQNVAIGDSALAANTSGFGNVAIGYQALQANTIGGSSLNGPNTAIGTTAMNKNLSGDNNVAVGVDALFTNTSGSNNVAVGSNAIGFGTGGISNTAVGYRALFNGGGGTANVAVGLTCLNGMLTGASNTGIGDSALFSNTAGSFNVAVGHYALLNNLGSSSVGIGPFAGAYETGSNAFYVDNQDRTNTAGDKAKALLYGVFAASPANQTLTVNAELIANHADAAINQLFAGTTKAVRIGHTATETLIEGVDVTGIASYQPLFIGGSTIVFQLSGATKATIAAGLQIGAPTGGDKGAGTINAAGAYYANGTAGVAAFGPAAVASITVKNGLITAIS